MIQTTLDLVNDALKKAGEKTDGSSDYTADALNYMDTFYRAILAGGNEFDVNLGEPWTWAKAKYPGVLNLQPPVTAGNVLLTQGSPAGVLDTPPAFSLIGYYIHQTGGGEYYRITDHVANDPNITLESSYNNPTGAGPFIAMLLDYDLNAANILRQIGPMKVYRTQRTDGDEQGKITGLDIRSFEKKYPMYRIRNGVPVEYAILYQNTAIQQVTVRFNTYVNELTKVDYDYIPAPGTLLYSSASVPIIPIEHRQCLSYATAFALMTDKEDNKAQTFFSLTKNKLQAMVNANRKEFMQISKNRGRLIARLDDYRERNWPTSGW